MGSPAGFLFFNIGFFGSDDWPSRCGKARSLPHGFQTFEPKSVLEALADFFDIILRHELSARVEIGGRDAAVDLQVKLHDRPEALQERLLTKRAGQVPGGDA